VIDVGVAYVHVEKAVADLVEDAEMAGVQAAERGEAGLGTAPGMGWVEPSAVPGLNIRTGHVGAGCDDLVDGVWAYVAPSA
jgi:hypothetical protein